MPAKKIVNRSRVSRSAKRSGFRFKWWMGVIILVVVVVIGVVVVRFSNAATVFPTAAYKDTVVEGGGYDWYKGKTCMRLQSSGRWCYWGRDYNIKAGGTPAILWGREGDARCATVWNTYYTGVASKFNTGAEHEYFPPGTKVTVAEYYYGTFGCHV